MSQIDTMFKVMMEREDLHGTSKLKEQPFPCDAMAQIAICLEKIIYHRLYYEKAYIRLALDSVTVRVHLVTLPLIKDLRG